jgi:hypothetical protein
MKEEAPHAPAGSGRGADLDAPPRVLHQLDLRLGDPLVAAQIWVHCSGFRRPIRSCMGAAAEHTDEAVAQAGTRAAGDSTRAESASVGALLYC